MSLSHYLAALVSGIGIGFTVAAPNGPMGMLRIRRTLASGMATGLAAGFGAATVHLTYSALAVLGLGSLAQLWVEANAVGFGIVWALTLLWFAIRTHRSSVVLQEGEVDEVRLIRAYLSAMALGLTNPRTSSYSWRRCTIRRGAAGRGRLLGIRHLVDRAQHDGGNGAVTADPAHAVDEQSISQPDAAGPRHHDAGADRAANAVTGGVSARGGKRRRSGPAVSPGSRQGPASCR